MSLPEQRSPQPRNVRELCGFPAASSLLYCERRDSSIHGGQIPHASPPGICCTTAWLPRRAVASWDTSTGSTLENDGPFWWTYRYAPSLTHVVSADEPAGPRRCHRRRAACPDGLPELARFGCRPGTHG